MLSTEVVDALSPLFAEYCTGTHLELEASLGVKRPDHFKPGVEFNYFKTLYQVLHTNPSWTHISTTQHFANFYFRDGVRGTYNSQQPTFLKKQVLRVVDLVIPERAYTIRVSLRQEVPQPTYSPDSPPTFVRLCERHTFVHKNIWQYDLSKVSQGTCKESACEQMPTFEVELELRPNKTMLLEFSTTQLTTSLVEKMIDLLGRFDTTYQPIPYTVLLSTSLPNNVSGPTS